MVTLARNLKSPEAGENQVIDPVVCQNSAELKPAQLQMLRRVLDLRSPPISSGFAGIVCQNSAEFWPSARGREWMNRIESLSSVTDSNSHGFPVRRNGFPALDHREFVASAAETLGNLSSDSGSRAEFGKDSLYFPCLTGISPQRRVRPRLPPPPHRLRSRDFPPGSRGWIRKSSRIRGVLAVEVF
jgi:hypothetical protein